MWSGLANVQLKRVNIVVMRATGHYYQFTSESLRLDLQGQHHLLPLRLASFRAYVLGISLPLWPARLNTKLVASDYLGGIYTR